MPTSDELVFGCDYCGKYRLPESSAEGQVRCKMMLCATCLRRPGRPSITKLAIRYDWTPDDPPLRKYAATKRLESRA